VETVREAGVEIEGVCLYPVVDYPGWENERVCPVGLLSIADERGSRTVCSSLAREVRRQQLILGDGEAERRYRVSDRTGSCLSAQGR
jgi:hypothetical protein